MTNPFVCSERHEQAMEKRLAKLDMTQADFQVCALVPFPALLLTFSFVAIQSIHG